MSMEFSKGNDLRRIQAASPSLKDEFLQTQTSLQLQKGSQYSFELTIYAFVSDRRLPNGAPAQILAQPWLFKR